MNNIQSFKVNLQIETRVEDKIEVVLYFENQNKLSNFYIEDYYTEEVRLYPNFNPTSLDYATVIDYALNFDYSVYQKESNWVMVNEDIEVIYSPGIYATKDNNIPIKFYKGDVILSGLKFLFDSPSTSLTKLRDYVGGELDGYTENVDLDDYVKFKLPMPEESVTIYRLKENINE